MKLQSQYRLYRCLLIQGILLPMHLLKKLLRLSTSFNFPIQISRFVNTAHTFRTNLYHNPKTCLCYLCDRPNELMLQSRGHFIPWYSLESLQLVLFQQTWAQRIDFYVHKTWTVNHLCLFKFFGSNLNLCQTDQDQKCLFFYHKWNPRGFMILCISLECLVNKSDHRMGNSLQQ